MAAAEPMTLAIDGKLIVTTLPNPEIMRLAWPAWKEGIHWAVGAPEETSDAGRALLAACALHGPSEPDPEPAIVGMAAEPLSIGDCVTITCTGAGPGVIRRAA